MHIETIKDLIVDVNSVRIHQVKRDLSELEDGFNLGSADRFPATFRTFGYSNINCNFNRLIHLLFHAKAFN